MSYKKWERRLIKAGMWIILMLAIILYFLYKKWSMTNSIGLVTGPPPAESLYYNHKAELLLWYDKFVIPFALPAFLYWFHKFIDSKYAKKEALSDKN